MPLVRATEDVKMDVYYRGEKGKLRQIAAWTTLDDVENLRQDVIKSLKDNMEPYTKPVLVLIKGGKA